MATKVQVKEESMVEEAVSKVTEPIVENIDKQISASNSASVVIDGKSYEFSLSRSALKTGEDRYGMDIVKLESQYFIQSERLWATGLLANHRDLGFEDAVSLLDKAYVENVPVSNIIRFLNTKALAFIIPTQPSTGKITFR